MVARVRAIAPTTMRSDETRSTSGSEAINGSNVFGTSIDTPLTIGKARVMRAPAARIRADRRPPSSRVAVRTMMRERPAWPARAASAASSLAGHPGAAVTGIGREGSTATRPTATARTLSARTRLPQQRSYRRGRAASATESLQQSGTCKDDLAAWVRQTRTARSRVCVNRRPFCFDNSVMTDHPATSTLIRPGTEAPGFELQSAPDRTTALREYRGRPVVLVFYPADWSPVCGDQIAVYNEMWRE